ncbi:protein translocase subunit SecD [Streptomyces sp. DHE17-7]|uniref:protein translocase subunit SecD n=1 Tax=Streptomyces sp. DHE17-7 TaxID=2759949 RepID=UPI0022EB67EB|nr:protein translocase subunit SecD [Streptomyces sp. DHE17-7]
MFASPIDPVLGSDLAGGTSITLRAVPEEGQESAINKTNMDTAVEIMERRVNARCFRQRGQTPGRREISRKTSPKGTELKEPGMQSAPTAQALLPPGRGDRAVRRRRDRQPLAERHRQRLRRADGQGHGRCRRPGQGHRRREGERFPVRLRLGERHHPGPRRERRPEGRPQPLRLRQGVRRRLPVPERQRLRRRRHPPACHSTTPPWTHNDERPAPSAATAHKDESMVACGQNSQGQWQKYILGPAAVDGTDVDEAEAVYNTQTAAGWTVTMKFTDEGGKKFADITGKLAQNQSPQNQFAIVLDNEVVSDPYVSQALTGGSAEISGNFDQEEAQALANMLSYGALPLTFKEDSVTTVTAALGGEQLKAGLIAGAIGLALVVIYLLVYYRGLSFIAVASLLVSAGLTYVIMSLLGPTIGFALNLPAVCGAIVAIGITADSFIVYFERVRDEIREGRSLRPAVERAWPRARRTILVSDFVSFLAAAVLFVVTVGKVQGFAFTLGLTTLLDVVVVFFFTKPLLTLMARRKFFSSGHKWSGLDPKSLGAKPPLRRTRRPARPVAGPVDPKEA